MVKRLTYLLITATAILLLYWWMPLMFVTGSVSDTFALWKSVLITGLYLFLLKLALKRKSVIGLIAIALGGCILAFIGNGVQGNSWESRFSFNQFFLPPILLVSALYWGILIKILHKYKANKRVYYTSAAFIGAVMAVLYFCLVGMSGIAYMAIKCKQNPASCID